ncbi:BRO family protein [Listeria seeligeri]|uniref:BRO family protein n=1 Tax=Listeria seeligeri TaxID=1640 RepID=UPI0028933FA8|nr:BRO family protein [Listeria seeligeri]
MNSTFINESGLYSAIIGSKLPTAKAFKHWVPIARLTNIRKLPISSCLDVRRFGSFWTTFMPWRGTVKEYCFSITIIYFLKEYCNTFGKITFAKCYL